MTIFRGSSPYSIENCRIRKTFLGTFKLATRTPNQAHLHFVPTQLVTCTMYSKQSDSQESTSQVKSAFYNSILFLNIP